MPIFFIYSADYLLCYIDCMNSIKQLCVQLADLICRKKYRKIEHRKFIRLNDSLTVKICLVDCKTGRSISKQITGSTVNISKEGLCIESSTATVDGVDIFNDAMSAEKCLDIIIVLPGDASSKEIKACGNVVWLDMTPKDKSFLFKAGIHLDLQKCSDAQGWYSLVAKAGRYKRGRFWPFNCV